MKTSWNQTEKFRSRTAAVSESLSDMSLEDNVRIYSSPSYNVSIFQRKWKYVWNFPHTLLVIYTLYRQTKTEFKGLALFAETQAFVEPSQSGKYMGLVVRVTDIKKMKKCTLLSMHYRIIYSTNMFHLRVTHGDRKRKAGRETKLRFAVEIATPITISWHDSKMVWLSISFFHLQH